MDQNLAFIFHDGQIFLALFYYVIPTVNTVWL